MVEGSDDAAFDSVIHKPQVRLCTASLLENKLQANCITVQANSLLG
jgi:hypothetical protein